MKNALQKKTTVHEEEQISCHKTQQSKKRSCLTAVKKKTSKLTVVQVQKKKQTNVMRAKIQCV